MTTEHNPIEVTQRRWNSQMGWDVEVKVPSVRASIRATQILGDTQASMTINVWPYAALTDVNIERQHIHGEKVRRIELTSRANHENHSTVVTLVLSDVDMQLLVDAVTNHTPEQSTESI